MNDTLTLLVWEGASPTNNSFGQALHSLPLRLLPASNLESCLKWLEGPVPIDALILNLEDQGFTRIKEYEQLKIRPEMWDIPTLVILHSKGLEEYRNFLQRCDDFITEKSSTEEIVLRTLHLLKKPHPFTSMRPQSIQLGKIEMDPKALRAHREGKDLPLTALEFRLLLYFLKHRGRVLSRDELLRQVWGYNEVNYTRTVDTFIKRLRAKMGKEGDWIETLRAVGYRLKDISPS